MTNDTRDADARTSERLFGKLKWMTSREAAHYLRVSVGQIRNMVWREQLQCYRLQNRLCFPLCRGDGVGSDPRLRIVRGR